MPIEFQVKKEDPSVYRIVECPEKTLNKGEIRLKVDKFSFTSNNLTYAAAGDSLGYWHFFPATENTENTWGIIPVWAFADVVESNNEEVAVGDRLYGYFPPASELVMLAANVSDTALHDGSAHRQALPPLYNRYRRVLNEPNYNRDSDAARILLAPLHLTSFCLWDQLKSQSYYGAEQVLIISASSKTSLGLAYGLAAGNDTPVVVGLTSDSNLEFVSSRELYDEAISYSAIDDKLQIRPTVIIDMAGNKSIKENLKSKLGDNINYYISVGLTHWKDAGGVFEGSGEVLNQESFFAPSYILEKIKNIGAENFDKESNDFVFSSSANMLSWMSLDQCDGLGNFSKVYPDVCDGNFSPASGLIVTI